MATATKQARSTRQRDSRAVEGDPREFRVFQTNGGDFRWEMVSRSGAALAQSGSFASFADAEHGAARVREGAASARLDPRSTGARPRVVA